MGPRQSAISHKCSKKRGGGISSPMLMSEGKDKGRKQPDEFYLKRRGVKVVLIREEGSSHTEKNAFREDKDKSRKQTPPNTETKAETYIRSWSDGEGLSASIVTRPQIQGEGKEISINATSRPLPSLNNRVIRGKRRRQKTPRIKKNAPWRWEKGQCFEVEKN